MNGKMVQLFVYTRQRVSKTYMKDSDRKILQPAEVDLEKNGEYIEYLNALDHLSALRHATCTFGA